MEHQVVHEVHVTTSTERIRNVEVIREIPVEMIREVPLTTYKETIREVPQKETIQIEKLVELQTTREVIKTVDVAKEVHHELVVEVPVESKVIETHAVEMLKDVIKEIVREVTVPLRTRVEVIKEVQLTKTFVQDRLVVTKDRVEVPQPVTVLKEIPLYIERIIEVPVREERIQEKLVELTKQVPVEIVRQVSINVPKVLYI